MSANSDIEYPDGLKASVWEKDKKSGFDAGSDVADKLKSLQKKHDAVDWKLFAGNWPKSAATLADLEGIGISNVLSKAQHNVQAGSATG